MNHEYKLFEFNFYNSKPIEEDEQSDDEIDYSQYELKRKKQDEKIFIIQMFGIDEHGEQCCIFVQDFKPFFYIKVPDCWYNDYSKLSSLHQHIISIVGDYYSNSILCEYAKHEKLYGFDNNKQHTFIKITFNNLNIYNKVKNLWYELKPSEDDENLGKSEKILIKDGYTFNDQLLELYETAIPPLLRYFHIQTISPSGWVALPKFKTVELTGNAKITHCAKEFIISRNDIIPLTDKDTPVPYNTMSFDIEASSSHGDFPIPVKNYKKLATNIIDYFTTVYNYIYDLNNFNSPSDRIQFVNEQLTHIIKTAFNESPTPKVNVDLVYPKYPVKNLNASIRKLLNSNVKDLKKHSCDEIDISESIEYYFSKISSNDKKDDEENETIDETEHNSDDEGEEHDEPINETECIVSYTDRFKKSKDTTSNTNYTLADIICDSTIPRDDKINEIIRLFKNKELFPPLEGDKITIIGSTFLRYGQNEPHLCVALVLNSCTDLQTVKYSVVRSFETERELLLAWTQLVTEQQPDIILGYNINTFDYEFMFRRAQELDCVHEFLKLSKNKDEICGTYDKVSGQYDIDRSLIILASGAYDLSIIKQNGRLQVDMLNWFRKTENLISYKLDYTSGYYIGDKISSLQLCPENNSTIVHTQNMSGLQIDSYIHFEEINHSSDYYKGGAKFKVIEINRAEKTFTIEGLENPHAKVVKWGLAKDDVSVKDIFRLTNEGPESRAIVAKYCIQDCNLVHYLFIKVDVMTDLIEMAKLCSVPMSYLIFRGQGIKLTSYVAKKCREKNTLMPTINKGNRTDGYEGAIVLSPKCGLYLEIPVPVGDFASLYPSSMLSENYCPKSKTWAKIYNLDGQLLNEIGEKDENGNFIYDNLPEREYVDMRFDTYKYIRTKVGAKPQKFKVGYKICRFVQPTVVNGKEEKSVMPAILQELLKARKDTRKAQKTVHDEFIYNILEKRQLAYKATANSLYGQLGAKTSTFYEPDIAAATTATGRMLLTYAKRVVEECYSDLDIDTKHGMVNTKAEYIYGDSVANYTPIYVKVNDSIDILTIEDLAVKYGGNNWIACCEEGKQDKEFCELENVETWSEQGWTTLYRVIRHQLASHKKMVRVLTHTGLVDVTDDHSLLRDDGTEISPNDLNIGDELLHHSLNYTELLTENICEFEAKIMGFFFGDGSCGTYVYNGQNKSSWALNNASLILLEEYKRLCCIVYPNYEWKILDTINSSGVYKLCPSNPKKNSIFNFVQYYRSKLYYNKEKIIPAEILNSNLVVKRAFWNGMYDADGDKDLNGYTRIDQKNQISAANIFILSSQLGYLTSINTRYDKNNIYRLTMTKKLQRKNPNKIKKIHQIDYSGYVYDLTTENHHFAAGVGNMIVHNTDSVFFTFNLSDKETGEKIVGEKALELSIELAQEACHTVSKFLKEPHDFEYEKTFMPLCLLSKKRYVGMKYEKDIHKCKRSEMGIVLKRRDNAPIVKDVYGGIIDILMKEQNLEVAIQYLNSCLRNLIDGNISNEKLIITKSLRSFYKNPQGIAHKVLADRIGEREPGNKPTSGDRVSYLYFVNNAKIPKGKKMLQGDKIETPDFIKNNKLQIDYSFYITNQIMKPLLQLFGLVLEDLWLKQRVPRHDKVEDLRRKIMAVSSMDDLDQTKIDKKISKIKDKQVQELLFDKYLIEIDNKKNKNQPITNFFKLKTK